MNEADRAGDWFLNGPVRDQVQGYLQETQARALNALLAHQASIGLGGSLAEIGVYLGKTLIGLARAARPDERVQGVDPLVIGRTDLGPRLTANLKAHLTQEEFSRVRIKKQLSTQLDVLAWMRGLNQAARFIHLDGHHARETILHDLQLAASWLQKGAVVVIDDFLNELHPDLTSGILDGLAAHPQLEPVAVIPRMGHIEEGGSKLVCATRGDGSGYRDALDRALADHLRPWKDRMLGAEVRVYRSRAPAPAAASAARPTAGPEPLPVVFALHDPDGRFWINAAVAIASLVEYAGGPLSIHLLHDETLSAPARERLTQIARDAQTPLTFTPVQVPPGGDLPALRQFSAASLFRLMIPKLFAQHETVVYLDCDLVVNGVDILDLAAAAPSDAAICAVPDPYIANLPNHAKGLADLDLDPEAYVNSGVLVLRPKLIEDDLVEAFVAFSKTHPDAIHPDQDFLNAHYRGRIHLLDPRFNFQIGVHARTMFRQLRNYQGKILHYVGRPKPSEGRMAPGLIPFWVHAHRVPEITHGALYSPTGFIGTVQGEMNVLRLVPFEQPPLAQKASDQPD